MGVSKYNSEGYYDPVVYEALTRMERHCIPIAPHLLCPQYLDEETERRLGLKMGIVFMGKCEEVWVFGDTVSEGMAAEIEKARKLRKKIRYFTDDLREKEGMAG